MPFINIKYSTDINTDQEDQIKYALGLAVQTIGKTEQWLMVGFEPNCSMYFNGERYEKVAFVEVSLFSLTPLTSSAYDKCTEQISSALNSVLGVPQDKIFVKYSLTEQWGWNGGNI